MAVRYEAAIATARSFSLVVTGVVMVTAPVQRIQGCYASVASNTTVTPIAVHASCPDLQKPTNEFLRIMKGGTQRFPRHEVSDKQEVLFEDVSPSTAFSIRQLEFLRVHDQLRDLHAYASTFRSPFQTIHFRQTKHFISLTRPFHRVIIHHQQWPVESSQFSVATVNVRLLSTIFSHFQRL